MMEALMQGLHTHGELLLAIVGAMVVTAIPRVLPMMYLATESLPLVVRRWLSFVPVAVLAALLGPDIFIQGGKLDISVHNIFLLVAGPAVLVAWWTKSFFGTILFSMGSVALARYLGLG